jgi:hypothetical protein
MTMCTCSTVLREGGDSFNISSYAVPVIMRSAKNKGRECGFSGLVVSMVLVPKFAGSNPAEAVGFFGRKKSSACLPSEGK